jgi:hypothetical protein
MLVGSVEAGMAGKRSRDTIPINVALLSGVPVQEVPGCGHAGGECGGGPGQDKVRQGFQVGLPFSTVLGIRDILVRIRIRLLFSLFLRMQKIFFIFF